MCNIREYGNMGALVQLFFRFYKLAEPSKRI